MRLHTLFYKDNTFSTNRLYIMQHNNSTATVVDPATTDEVLMFLDEYRCNLAAILITHHHTDHTSGVSDLFKIYPNCLIIAGDGVQYKIPQINHILSDGHYVVIGDTYLTAIATPGHTLDHYAFYTNSGILFAGDCLFRLGCGRIFEGTYDMLWSSLRRLRALPDDTIVCCGHDYVIDNVRFTLRVLPADQVLIKKLNQYMCVIPENRLPFLLSEDKTSNLFLRADQSEVMIATNTTNVLDCIAVLRQIRDVI